MRAKISPKQIKVVLEFARDNGVIINPAGYGYHVQSFAEHKCCPCAPERKNCPCDEAPGEIKELGKCKCQLFWRDYQTYLEEKFK